MPLYGDVWYNQASCKPSSGRLYVPQEVEEAQRAHIPHDRAGLPRRERQEQGQDRQEPRLRRRPRGGARRPRRPLRGGVQAHDRRGRARRGAHRRGAHRLQEDRQARRGPRRARRGGAVRLPPPRPRDLVALRAQAHGARVLLRPLPDPGASRVGPHRPPLLQARRLGGQGEVPPQVRLHGRRRLPLPDLPGRQRRRARELDECVAGGVARAARRVVPVPRRHQLLLRVRGGGRLQDARRLQGAQAQPDRADGAVPGLRRPAPGLRALPRQPQRHDHAAAGHVQGGRARPAPGGSGW